MSGWRERYQIVTEVRALGLLMGVRGDAKPLAFVEDTAVAVAKLPRYIARFEEIIRKHSAECVFYGHASVGELHVRPVLDLKRPDQVETLKRIATEVADLVAEFGGSLSGEHGTDFDKLYKSADEAVYHSKKSGRNRVTRYRGVEIGDDQAHPKPLSASPVEAEATDGAALR